MSRARGRFDDALRARRGLTVQTLDESATVDVAELVRDDMRGVETALHEQRGAGVAQLVKPQALPLGPAPGPTDVETV
jgi:hypothetical protein